MGNDIENFKWLIESKLIGIPGQLFQHHFAHTYALVQSFHLDDNTTFVFNFIGPQNVTLNVE